jgi:hypothetical protein
MPLQELAALYQYRKNGFAAGEIRNMPLLTTTGEHARILK